ncbi:hydrogenase expression/formation protein [Pseudaquabacterium pictum]|uniref:Hydrogenase expression/formation protein n=1 Tax=Pseudaquabacterium pictum TaxID=2315236 RepID=A0A480AQB8_9BURK|nr:hydrogenase expression/formation protein [Rubrivivax pictus]GCL62537.1 hydrogenase expression/formation protein [Rubrivivax pictus]
MKEFPIPVVAALVGPGSQAEDETLDYLPMPGGMATFQPPLLPEPEAAAPCHQGRQVLHQALAALAAVQAEGGRRSVPLDGLPAADLRLVNQVLGEGEVSAVVQPAQPGGASVQVQESVFAGLWRVITSAGGVVLHDTLEVAAIPQALHEAALADAATATPPPRWTGALPPEVQNAPALLAEIDDQLPRCGPGQPAHVINLTLLPMSPADIGFLDHHLGTGRVLILSRGYGNCRISNTLRAHGWRVVYYNSQDVVILNTVELVDLPAVAQAAPEDIADSHARLAEVLAWVDGS